MAAKRHRDQREMHRLRKDICQGLNADRTKQFRQAAAAAEAALNQGDIRGTFGVVKGWYKDVGPPLPQPSLADAVLDGAIQLTDFMMSATETWVPASISSLSMYRAGKLHEQRKIWASVGLEHVLTCSTRTRE